jgi:SAM-dependent MidA family methyltransferase
VSAVERPAGWVGVRDAWQWALYGPNGFYRRNRPSDHFRTSAHAGGDSGGDFARALLGLARERGLRCVWDVGAGGGELLAALARLDPDLELHGVDLAARPGALLDRIHWHLALPTAVDGLVVANELLDTVPCDVVGWDTQGRTRLVEVEIRTGRQRLGPLVPDTVSDWLERWWPPGDQRARAEVGLPREEAWAAIRATNPTGTCVAIDYGHQHDTRPGGGTLASFRHGRSTEVTFDGAHDVTAHVAIDALQARVPGELLAQHAALDRWTEPGSRPRPTTADADPAGYLRGLAEAGRAAELREAGGLGDHYWLISPLSRLPG